MMLNVLREYHFPGVAAGAIRTAWQALLFSDILLNVMGEQWLQKDYFRIGASSLAVEILKNLNPK